MKKIGPRTRLAASRAWKSKSPKIIRNSVKLHGKIKQYTSIQDQIEMPKHQNKRINTVVRRLYLQCAMFSRGSVNKRARVVYTWEVYKYAIGTYEIRARKARHETVKKWELLEPSRALLAIICKVSTTLGQFSSYSGLATPVHVFARELELCLHSRVRPRPHSRGF